MKDGIKPKENTLQYTLKINEVKVRVIMFLDTLLISNAVPINAIRKEEHRGLVKIEKKEDSK